MSSKYTLSLERKKWIEVVQPGLLELVKILKSIQWNDYSYEGSSLVEFVGKSKEENTIHLEATISEVPYKLFGGICYNILHDEYKAININNFLDFTGDIDVHLYCPTVEIQKTKEMEDFFKNNENEPDGGMIKCISKTDEGINDLVKHYMHWVFYQVEKMVSETFIDNHFPNHKEITESEISGYLRKNADVDLLTPAFGFRKANIANKAYLLCFVDDSTVRVQLIMSSGLSLEHALEFIFRLPSDRAVYTDSGIDMEYSPKISKGSTLDVNGFIIEDPQTLMISNAKAYLDRVNYVNDKRYSHKAINHTARILYLLVISKVYKKQFPSLISGVKYWIEDIKKRNENIIFYYITPKGEYQKKEIEISEFLIAFQSVLPPMQFIRIDKGSVYDEIQDKINEKLEKGRKRREEKTPKQLKEETKLAAKKLEEEAFKHVMTIVNGNRFFKRQPPKDTMRNFLRRGTERSLNKSKSLRKRNSRTMKRLGSLSQGSLIKSRKSKMSFKAASI